MESKNYQALAMRTNDGKCTDRLQDACTAKFTDVGGIVNASLGLSGEVGELNDSIKKAIFHGHDIDTYAVKKEIGDILWYVALMCHSFGFDMGEIMEINIAKLKARYPDGFSEYLSQHRQEGDK